MDGLIPLLLHAIRRQKPQNITRCLSDNSTTSRSYHLLLSSGGGDSTEGSSHRRTRSEFQPPSSTVDEHLARLRSFSPRTPAAAPSGVDDGLRQRGHASAAAQYEVSGRVNNYRR